MATIGKPFHTLLFANLILIDPPIIGKSFRGNKASYGSASPHKKSVVYIVLVVLAVTIALSNSSNATKFLRNESNNPPSLLFVSNYLLFCILGNADNIASG